MKDLQQLRAQKPCKADHTPNALVLQGVMQCISRSVPVQWHVQADRHIQLEEDA